MKLIEGKWVYVPKQLTKDLVLPFRRRQPLTVSGECHNLIVHRFQGIMTSVYSNVTNGGLLYMLERIADLAEEKDGIVTPETFHKAVELFCEFTEQEQKKRHPVSHGDGVSLF